MAYTPAPQSSRYILITVPILVSVLALLLSSLPAGKWGGIPLAPSLVLVSIFYWSVYRPELFPVWLTFCLGICQDLISQGPLGMWALVYLIVQALILNSRQFLLGTAAYSPWFAFFAASLLTGLLAWLVAMVYEWKALSPVPALGQALWTAAIYPLAAAVLSMIERRFFAMR